MRLIFLFVALATLRAHAGAEGVRRGSKLEDYDPSQRAIIEGFAAHAEQSFQKGDYAEAVRNWRMFLTAVPEDVSALEGLERVAALHKPKGEWGSPVGGLRCQAMPDFIVVSRGEWPLITIWVENISDRPIHFPDFEDRKQRIRFLSFKDVSQPKVSSKNKRTKVVEIAPGEAMALTVANPRGERVVPQNYEIVPVLDTSKLKSDCGKNQCWQGRIECPKILMHLRVD